MPDDAVTMDKVVALCKRRGVIFPASEIYGGIANTYDYGHYGVLLKRNVVDAWWQAMIGDRDDIVALDSAIIQHPRTWEASGHLAGFTDPLVDCRTCKLRFRADHLEEARAAGAPGDGAGDLPGLQDRARLRAQEAAVRHRPGREVLPQRDHAGQLHLPHARVRADGDGVLRPARRRPDVV